MVDVAPKQATMRQAVAKGLVVMQPATMALLGAADNKKGDVLGVARVAGIMAAKRTAALIPLCHALMLDSVSVEFALLPEAVEITATVGCTGRTGVEMEALTAVSVAALTIYDMLKAAERGMRIEAIRVVQKSGGASGDFVQP